MANFFAQLPPLPFSEKFIKMTAAPAVGFLNSKDSKIQRPETGGKPYQITVYPDGMGAKPCRRGGNGLPNRGGYPDRQGVTCRVGGNQQCGI